jgi:hypothetical protein
VSEAPFLGSTDLAVLLGGDDPLAVGWAAQLVSELSAACLTPPHTVRVPAGSWSLEYQLTLAGVLDIVSIVLRDVEAQLLKERYGEQSSAGPGEEGASAPDGGG